MFSSKTVYDRRSLDIIKRILGRWGYPLRGGLIYGILLLSPKPLTIREIMDITGMSRSSVSASLNILIREYMVNVRKEGRTKLFSPIPAFYEKFMEQPSELLNKEVLPLKERIKIIMERIGKGEEDYRNKLMYILKDLDSLEKIIRNIIELERRGV